MRALNTKRSKYKYSGAAIRLTFSALFLSVSSICSALPSFSYDDNALFDLSVNGRLYDVKFQRGVAGDIFAGIDFDQAYMEDAIDLRPAIREALNALNITSDAGGANCDSGLCFIFLPEQFLDSENFFFASEVVVYEPGFPVAEWQMNSTADGGMFVGPPCDTNNYNSTFGCGIYLPDWLVLATFSEKVSPAPIASSAHLVMLALTVLMLRRGRKYIFRR